MLTRLFLLALLVAAPAAHAQSRLLGPDTRLYGGAGLGRGLGVLVEGASPALDLFTREAALVLAYRAAPDTGSARVVASASIGGSLRLLRLASAARPRGIPAGDLDIGLRVGPSFSAYTGTPTDAQRSRAFAIFADPFVRATRRVGARVVFVELGSQTPTLRAGLSARIGSIR